MPTSFPTWVKLGWRDTSEKPTPVIVRSEVERGIPRHRRMAADSLVTVPLTAYFDTALEANAFESWFFGEALAGADWFSFTLPRNGQVVQARFKDGEIGPLKPTTKTFAFSERSFELEYVRPGFRTLPPGRYSIPASQILQVQRASTATFVDAAGVLQTVAAHVARFTYFSGKNIYSGPVDLVAGPGVYGALHFLKTATDNPANLQPGETITVSAQVYQDSANISDGQARLARLYFWFENAATVWQQAAFIDGAVLSPSGRLSATFTLPSLASDMTRVGVGIYHQPGNLSFDLGTVRADAIMVERDAVDTAYEPAARLLVESAASNLVTQSDNISLWTSNGATLSPTPVMAPDGSLSARVMPLVTGTMYQAIVLPVSQPVTVSQYIKPEPGSSSVRLYVDGGGAPGGSVYVDYQVPGMVLAFATPGVSRSAIRREPNGWYRVDFSFTPIAGFASVHAYPLAFNQAFWRTQVEPGLVATSPIQTTTTAVTRAADVIQVTA